MCITVTDVNMSILKDKIALVTGSSRGIGVAIAKLFAQQGAKVVLHGRKMAALSAAQAEIERVGGKAMHVVADVTKFTEIEEMRRQIEQISEEGWRASVDANLTATFLTIKSILPGMKERKAGNIITLSSAAARRPHPGSPVPYAAAKAGIQILTQDLSAQVGPYGIRANCIAPETILTERNEQRIPDSQKQALVEIHPIRRLGTPEDVARAALFLASDDAAWITGIVLDVAGGSVMV